MKNILFSLSLLTYCLFAMDSSDDDAQKKALEHISGKIKSVLQDDSNVLSSPEKEPSHLSSLDLTEEWKQKIRGLEHSNLVLQLAKANKESGFPLHEKEFLSEVDSTIGQWGSSDERAEDLKSIESLSHSSSQDSLSSTSSAEIMRLLSTSQVNKIVLKLLAESYENYDKKQQGKIIFGKRITKTAVVILALALLTNIIEIGVIITEAVFTCTGN